MTRRKIFLSILAALLLLLSIFLAGRWFWHGGQWTDAREDALEITRLPPDACDLNQTPCRVEVPGGGALIAELAPRPLALLQPLTVRLILRDVPAQSALLTLSGVNMEMPFDPVPLQKIAPDQFIGQATLHICVTGRMRWRAEFRITNQRRQTIVEFLFDSRG
ncbi:MAG: hypothetical protein LBC37_07865 [Zoogloeaceae bacterium]|jgi:hypothetical protein|nr:hypothetical protein [Zoogloeaceae bacterium]